jgi:hypothetical protein
MAKAASRLVSCLLAVRRCRLPFQRDAKGHRETQRLQILNHLELPINTGNGSGKLKAKTVLQVPHMVPAIFYTANQGH